MPGANPTPSTAEMIQRLAARRAARLRGELSFDLTADECLRSAQTAMRLAGADPERVARLRAEREAR